MSNGTAGSTGGPTKCRPVTSKNRARQAAQQAGLEQIVGRARHQVDLPSHPKPLVKFSRTKPPSSANPLIQELLDLIHQALAHVNDQTAGSYPLDFDALADSANLTDRQSRCLELRMDGRSWLEITAVMSIKRSTAQSHVAAALDKLRKRIKQNVIVGDQPGPQGVVSSEGDIQP